MQKPNLLGHRGLWIRLAVVAAIGAAAVVLVVLLREQVDLATLAERETQLRRQYEERPAATLATAFAAYVVVTGLSLPFGVVMSILYGWLFGFWPAVILVSFASTTGATVAFLLSRHLFGNAIQARYGDRLAGFNRAIEREGAFYLFTLRLIPQVPFFVINAGMGLTKLPTRTFWWVSQLGMLPLTCVFVSVGANAPGLKEVAEQGLTSILNWRLITALALAGIAPLLLRWTILWIRRNWV